MALPPVAEESGVTIVMTPVQLYAAINGKSISQGELASNSWHEMPRRDYREDISRFLSTLPEPPSGRQQAWDRQTHVSQRTAPGCWVPPPVRPLDEATANRAGAGLQIVGGALEMTGGALLILAPEPTMVTKVGGSALALHGFDTTQAAIRQLFSGRRVDDYTQMAGTWAAKEVGASDKWAGRVGVILDVAVPSIVFAGMAGATKVMAIRAGRIILSEDAVAGKVGRVSVDVEEGNKALGKEGGHTKEMHIDKSDAFLETRAMMSRDSTRVFTRFASKEIAEDAINDALRANRTAIQQWATSATRGTKEFELECKRILGDGFSNATGTYSTMTKVRIVFKVAQSPGKTIYIVTAYPIP